MLTIAFLYFWYRINAFKVIFIVLLYVLRFSAHTNSLSVQGYVRNQWIMQ